MTSLRNKNSGTRVLSDNSLHIKIFSLQINMNEFFADACQKLYVWSTSLSLPNNVSTRNILLLEQVFQFVRNLTNSIKFTFQLENIFHFFLFYIYGIAYIMSQ